MSNESVQSYTDLIEELYAAVTDISENVSFINNELPSLNIPDFEELNISQACEEFNSAIYDVRKEIRNLEDKLGMHPDQQPFDPNIKNPDPRVTMECISNWLWNEIEIIQGLVKQLEELSKARRDFGVLYALVSESAAYILGSYIKLKDTLDLITARLELK